MVPQRGPIRSGPTVSEYTVSDPTVEGPIMSHLIVSILTVMRTEDTMYWLSIDLLLDYHIQSVCQVLGAQLPDILHWD